MRIISQDRTSDTPYGNCAITIKQLGEKWGIWAFGMGESILLGEYNSLDDARAVLRAITENNIAYYEMPQTDEDLSYAHKE